MILIKNNEVQVTKKVDNSSFKEPKILFLLCMIFSLFFFVSFKILGLFLFFINAILFIISEYFYKKEWPEKKVLSFSKDNLTLYFKNKNKIINTSKITSFSYITNSNSVRVNYTNENGKKKSQLINISAKDASDFSITANNLIDNNFSNISSTDEDIYLTDFKSENDIFDNLKKGNTVLAKLIGKTKLLSRDGNNYKLDRFSSLVFITNELVIFYIQIPKITIDFSQIKIGGDYLITRSYGLNFSATLSNSQLIINENDMKKIRTTLEIKNNTFFDEEKVQQELKLEKNYMKKYKIFSCIIITYFLLIPAVVLFIRNILKIYMIIYFFLLMGGLVYLGILILQMKKKCMKLYK